MDNGYKRTTSGNNRFVPQGSRNGRGGGGAHPTADASVSIGLDASGYGTDPVPRNPYGALGPDQQDFNDLNDAITNILDGDTSNSVAIRNPARTGALRVTANQRVSEPPSSTAKHYHATTTYTYNYLYMFLYALSIVASIIYVIVRLIYIGQGRQSVEIPVNRGFFDVDGNVITAGELLEEVGLGLGDEIPQSVLDNPRYEVLRRIVDDNTYSFWWSCCVLAAEIGGFILVHLSQQMFKRQDTKFFEMSPERVAQLREIVARRGVLQLVNIMVCTYNEPVETVKLCVEHLLAAEAPVYCKKVIYIGDDGAKKKFQCSEDKRLMCEEFARRGHNNVVWVGDRKSLPHQLNGKSSNINHMVLKHMYPNIRQTADVPHKDILMVMDCDHLVEPEFFAKACAVMLDKECAVCLIPQSFHNEVQPDCFDNSNYNFMFRLMPYYFGAGCCFVTGTNVMVRARAAFMACRFDENPHGHETQSLPSGTKKLMEEQLQGDNHRQLFSEVLVAEDIDLGSRVHTLGFRSVFLAEVLAKGEVPRDARSIWKQRSRWAAAAHMYILDPSSVFWRKQPHMSFWQKSLYWIPMVLHWTLIWSEPIMFTMPIMCLVFDICPYGIDPLLWFTHFAKLVTTFLISSYADTLELSRAAIYGQTMARVLFFVNVKAVLNTVMVYTGWKRPGAFKVTVKAGGAPKPAAGAVEEKPAEKPVEEEVERDNGGPMIPRVLKGLKLYKIHDSLSKITEARKNFMPWEGTFDFWVLLGITVMNLVAVAVGFIRLGNKSAIISVRGCENENVQLIALVFGFVEAVPGLLFLMYMATQEHAEWVMKIWVPLLIGSISIVCILIEFRVGVQYIGQLFDNPDFLPRPGDCAEAQPGL